MRILPESSKPGVRLIQGFATLPRARPHTQLPLQPKAMIGRARELGLAHDRLLQSDVRLLTLTGPPGVGKTRFAVALAETVVDEFDAGVCFVDLAPIADARLVVDAIARALDLRDLDPRAAEDALVEFLANCRCSWFSTISSTCSMRQTLSAGFWRHVRT